MDLLREPLSELMATSAAPVHGERLFAQMMRDIMGAEDAVTGFRANGKSRGEDEETGVSAKILSFNAANLDFRGWDTVKKRRVLDRVEVELGLHRDIETACVKKMVQLMRQGGGQDVKWNSERLNKKLTLSVRVADTEQLENFLYQELFPRYRRSAAP